MSKCCLEKKPKGKDFLKITKIFNEGRNVYYLNIPFIRGISSPALSSFVKKDEKAIEFTKEGEEITGAFLVLPLKEDFKTILKEIKTPTKQGYLPGKFINKESNIYFIHDFATKTEEAFKVLYDKLLEKIKDKKVFSVAVTEQGKDFYKAMEMRPLKIYNDGSVLFYKKF
jgi:hypothetical protein